MLSDGPAVVRIDSIKKNTPGKSYYATAWPVDTLLASSWDTTLVKKIGIAFGNEVKEYGIDILLGPEMNIHRNPLGGRNFEYYSEDPLVSSMMAAAMVKGIESNGVGTSIKHFAANNEETDRNTINTIVSERALPEIYLKGFEIAVKMSQPWTVMSSNNLINGTYTSERYDLLTSVLRKDWNFKGFVITDWFGKDALVQMIAGIDLLMPGSKNQTEAILDAVKNGTLSEIVLNNNVARILSLIVKSPTFNSYKHSDHPDLKQNAELARKAFHDKGKKVIIILNIGGVIEVKQWRDDVDAILLAWQPGIEDGNAITDVLTAKVNPSGKLATTFPAKYNDKPTVKNFPGKEFPEKAGAMSMGVRSVPAEVIYEE